MKSNPFVTLTRPMFRTAEAVERLTMANLKERPNYTKLHIERRFYFGAIGEEVVAAWFRAEGVEFIHRIDTSGNSRPVEFIVTTVNDGKMRVEVKAASKPYYKMLMYPARQKEEFDVMLGVRLDIERGRAEIMGCARRVDVEAWKVSTFGEHTTPTRACPYAELWPASVLLQWIRYGYAADQA